MALESCMGLRKSPGLARSSAFFACHNGATDEWLKSGPVSMALFQPFRALGLITDAVPFAVQRRGTQTFVTVSVGKAWQVRDRLAACMPWRGCSRCMHDDALIGCIFTPLTALL